jgi:hypothetical protein
MNGAAALGAFPAAGNAHKLSRPPVKTGNVRGLVGPFREFCTRRATQPSIPDHPVR